MLKHDWLAELNLLPKIYAVVKLGVVLLDQHLFGYSSEFFDGGKLLLLDDGHRLKVFISLLPGSFFLQGIYLCFSDSFFNSLLAVRLVLYSEETLFKLAEGIHRATFGPLGDDPHTSVLDSFGTHEAFVLINCLFS